MCHSTSFDPYSGLGGGLGHGGYRQTTSQTYSDPIDQSNYANQGTPALTAVANAQAQALYTAQASFFAAAHRTSYEPPEDTGIEAGEIIAWRCWQVTKDYELRSMFTNTSWTPGEIMTGEVKDGAGVHAWKHKMDAVMYGKEEWMRPIPIVVGTIKLWGEVIEHETGYRASAAKIQSLDFLLNKWFRRREVVLRKLREKYLQNSND